MDAILFQAQFQEDQSIADLEKIDDEKNEENETGRPGLEEKALQKDQQHAERENLPTADAEHDKEQGVKRPKTDRQDLAADPILNVKVHR